MSDPTAAGRDSGRSRGTAPIHLAPWVAMAAMAVAALWPKGRRSPLAARAPRALTPSEYDACEPKRGRCAEWPLQIPRLGWKDIVWRTYREMGRHRLPALAGGVTYYVLLATFPAIAAFVSLYSLYFDVGTLQRWIGHLAVILPRDAVSMMSVQMQHLATQKHATLSAAFVISTLLSIWSANAGMKAMFDGLNITYGEVEKRDYLRRSLITYFATFLALVFLALVVAVLVGAPFWLRGIGLHGFGGWLGPVRWLAVYVVAAGAFSLLYRYGPSRQHARWRWVLFGGMIAALAWLGVSLAFSWYVNNVVHLGVTYGSIGAVIAYMLWVWFSAMVVLTGSELNSEVEHQTAVDTTIGKKRVMGERGAVMADTLGKAFTTSPQEAADWFAAFCGRQVGYVRGFLRRLVGLASAGQL
ncbi:MAG TPA: YihY/virulence factor BrkB family protein [Caulobacteraceae bacterium]